MDYIRLIFDTFISNARCRWGLIVVAGFIAILSIRVSNALAVPGQNHIDNFSSEKYIAANQAKQSPVSCPSLRAERGQAFVSNETCGSAENQRNFLPHAQFPFAEIHKAKHELIFVEENSLLLDENSCSIFPVSCPMQGEVVTDKNPIHTPEPATEGGENEIHPTRPGEKRLSFATTARKNTLNHTEIFFIFKDLQVLYCSFLI